MFLKNQTCHENKLDHTFSQSKKRLKEQDFEWSREPKPKEKLYKRATSSLAELLSAQRKQPFPLKELTTMEITFTKLDFATQMQLWTPKCCENCLLCIAHLLVVVYIACAKNFSLFPHAMQYLSLSKKKTEYQKVFAPIIPKSTNNCFFLKDSSCS